MDWTVARLAQYARWRTRVGYHDLRRQVELTYARFAVGLPVRDPDFIGIGAPRAASTWLYGRLALHPDVCLSKKKEIHFFDETDVKERWGYGPDTRRPPLTLDLDNPHHWRWYRSHFGHCGSKLTGELTPDYSLLSVQRIGIIKTHLPNLKLIYSMRNPVARAWSSIRKELWWRFHMHPRDVTDAAALVRMAMRPGLLARGDYMSAIKRWETHYRGQILYLFFDDILENPVDALGSVCDFLGLDSGPINRAAGHATRVNDVPEDDIPGEVRGALEEYYAPQAAFLSERFGRSFAHWFAVPQIGSGPRI